MRKRNATLPGSLQGLTHDSNNPGELFTYHFSRNQYYDDWYAQAKSDGYMVIFSPRCLETDWNLLTSEEKDELNDFISAHNEEMR